MTINTIDEALAWMKQHARAIGAEYTVNPQTIEQLIKVHGSYYAVLKDDQPEAISFFGEMLIGAIQAYEANAMATELHRTMYEAVRDVIKKSDGVS